METFSKNSLGARYFYFIVRSGPARSTKMSGFEQPWSHLTRGCPSLPTRDEHTVLCYIVLTTKTTIKNRRAHAPQSARHAALRPLELKFLKCTCFNHGFWIFLKFDFKTFRDMFSCRFFCTQHFRDTRQTSFYFNI